MDESESARPGGAAAGAGLLLAASMIWGTTGAAQQLADVGASGPLVGATRLVVGAGALLAVMLVAGRHRTLRRMAARPLRRWTISAGLATAIFQAAFFSAVDRTGVALGTVVALGSAPVFCGLLARRLLAEPLPRVWTAATACAVGGCTLLLLPGASGAGSLLGVGLALIAGASYGVYTTCAKRLLDERADTIAVLTATLGVGALLSSPVLLTGVTALASPRGLLLIGWVGLVATAGAYVLFARGLMRAPAATAGTLSLAEPLVASVLGVALLAERPSAAALAGACLLAVGLALAALIRGPKPISVGDPVASPA